MTLQDRVAFWSQFHHRLAQLGHRLDSATRAKVLGKVHARIPVPAPGEQDTGAANDKAAPKIKLAKHNANIWTTVRDDCLWIVEQKKALVAKLEKEIAASNALAMQADACLNEIDDNVRRLKAGENVEIGEAIDMDAIAKRAGWTLSMIRAAPLMADLSKGEFAQYLVEREQDMQRRERFFFNKFYKRVRG